MIRVTRNIDEKDRLRAILAYDDHDISDIADILKIGDSTTYKSHGPRGGSDRKLTVRQEIELHTCRPQLI